MGAIGSYARKTDAGKKARGERRGVYYRALSEAMQQKTVPSGSSMSGSRAIQGDKVFHDWALKNFG